jgi:predicted ArsR family transcriptional regulator
VSQEHTRRQGDEAIDAVAGLADPLRRRLFAFVAASALPVGRDEAAAAVGISPSLAGYHLDVLTDDGLLERSRIRRSGRAGPGAGRPAKLYRVAPTEVTVQLPPRDDALVAHLLATAVEKDDSGVARAALREATREAGRALGRAAAAGDDPRSSMVDVLRSRGYAPAETDDGAIRLRNCPFHHLVDEHLDLVCSLNADLLGAAAEAAGGELVAVLDPQPGACCVVLRRAAAPGIMTG